MNATPTCKNKSIELPPRCLDCIDNDFDTFVDFAGLDGNESTAADNDATCASFQGDFEGSLPGSVPEFSTIGIILALIIAALGIAYVVKRRE